MKWMILLVLIFPIVIFQWYLFKDVVGCSKGKRVERNRRKDKSQFEYDKRRTENLRAVK